MVTSLSEITILKSCLHQDTFHMRILKLKFHKLILSELPSIQKQVDILISKNQALQI